MSLHLVFSITGLGACLARRMGQDPIVLLGDGVYAQAEAPADMTVVLADDGLVRGVKTLPELREVDYAQLVQMTVEHALVVSWND